MVAPVTPAPSCSSHFPSSHLAEDGTKHPELAENVRILFLLSGASYLPQLHRIWVHGDCQGISLGYLLLNLISATEQFTIGLFVLVNHKRGTDLFVEIPITTGDWLKLTQLTLISIMPLFIDAVNRNFFGPPEWRRWGEAFFSGYHAMFMNPIVTILVLVALPCQARAMHAQPVRDLKSLSLLGLLAQGVIFGVVAVSWTMRVRSMDLSSRDVVAYRLLTFVSWYQMVGWAAVNNAVFALVQILLLCLARNWRGEKMAMADGEREPLLGALDILRKNEDKDNDIASSRPSTTRVPIQAIDFHSNSVVSLFVFLVLSQSSNF
ncbi:hypothetical protein N7520_008923 [Penicillium odoratum]|uniref:uncharacterized protein n=1 Tax=Penicillium odoratum TaxID=1167516 RepID=UPI0025487E47|nr:uncharacterized protein N7520_008923 [Penicillium odoratum]KAJ5752006.1 hypothetical protein N7520_008923 [Penicillium odoratum]